MNPHFNSLSQVRIFFLATSQRKEVTLGHRELFQTARYFILIRLRSGGKAICFFHCVVPTALKSPLYVYFPVCILILIVCRMAQRPSLSCIWIPSGHESGFYQYLWRENSFAL